MGIQPNSLINSFASPATSAPRVSNVLKKAGRIEATTGSVIGKMNMLGMAPLFAGVLAFLGGMVSPAKNEDGSYKKEMGGFRSGVVNFLNKPIELLSAPLSKFIDPKTLESIGGSVANTVAGAGKLVGSDTRAQRQLDNFDSEYKRVYNQQKGSKLAGMDAVMPLLDTRAATYKAFAEAPNNEALKNAYVAAETAAANALKKVTDTLPETPPFWKRMFKADPRTQVGKLDKAHQGAMREQEQLQTKVNFFQDPKKVAGEIAQKVTGQQLISGAMQVAFVAQQAHSTHTAIKSERVVMQEMLHDVTGKDLSKGATLWLGVKALFGSTEAPAMLREPLKIYAKNALFRTFFLGAETVVLPYANKAVAKSSMGRVMGAGGAIMAVQQVASLAKGFAIKPNDLISVYAPLHAAEMQGAQITPPDMLALVMAGSPEIAKKGKHSVDAQVLANYFVHAGCTVSQVMQHMAQGGKHMNALVEEARFELIDKPEQQQKTQQPEVAHAQEPSGKWADFAKNSMRAVHGDKFTDRVAANSGAMSHAY